jgi:hypothetical protein
MSGSASALGVPVSKTHTRAVRDFAPHIQAAGRVNPRTHESAAAALTATLERHLPGAQAAHSTISRAEPGLRLVPVAQLNDPRPPASHSYGVRTAARSDGDLLSQHQTAGALERRIAAERETRYLSAAAEPLGKSMVRGHKLPDAFAGENGEAFGVRTEFGVEAKTVIFPTDVVEPEPEETEIYKRSHNSYAPGEQKKAGYNWSRVGHAGDDSSPNDFRFGATEHREENGVARTIDMDTNTQQVTKTTVVSLRLGKHREDNGINLGRTKPMGKRDPGLPPDHVFGKSTAGRDEWGAGALVRGAYDIQDQLPDPDLGRAKRTLDAPDRDDRVYGVPSVRYDIAAPRVKSVANHNNYGGEPNASGVVHPPKYAALGLFEEDFCELLDKGEMYDLVMVPEMEIDEDDFEAFWSHARRSNGGANELTIAQFRASMLALQ